MDRMINALVDKTESLLEATRDTQLKEYFVIDMREEKSHKRIGPFESREAAIQKRVELANEGLKQKETPQYSKFTIIEADYKMGTQGTTQKIPAQAGTELPSASAGKGKEALPQPKIPAAAGKEMPNAKATRSQKSGEKADGEGDVKKEGKDPGDAPAGTAPKQAGRPMPDGAKTKSQSKGDEPGAVKNEKKEDKAAEQAGDDPTKTAGKTKTTDNASKEPGDVEDQTGEKKKKKNESRVNEQPEDEEPPADEEGAEDKKKKKPAAPEAPGDEPTDAPGEIAPPEGGPGEAALPEQEYLGSKGDTFYYMKRDQNDSGATSDIILVDAEGAEIIRATDKEIDPEDMFEFVKAAIQEVEIEAVSYDIVANYIFPKLEELANAEEEEDEIPADEEDADADVNADDAAADVKNGPAKEGRVPKIPFDKEEKLIKDLMEKHGLKV